MASVYGKHKVAENGVAPIDNIIACSQFVLMGVETIGDAYDASWRVRARCAWGRATA